jgi:hypothetical protein
MCIHEVNDVVQTGMHADEPLVPERNPFESYKSPGLNRITANLIQAGGKTIY